MKHLTRSIGLIAVLLVAASCTRHQAPPDEARVNIMTYNILYGGTHRGQPLAQTVKVIRAADADVVGIQEALDGDTAALLAEQLGWNMVRQGRSPVILTRCEVVQTYTHGARLRHDSGREFDVFNLHLPAHPYQPYELLGIAKTRIATEQEAIANAQQARGRELAAVMEEIKALPDPDTPVFVTGDFNEPSHLDWTDAAANAGRHPIKAAYPASSAMARAGFVDAWRVIYPDEMTHPGDTWTPVTRPDDPKDHHDRIDFVYFRGRGVQVTGVLLLGENQANADIAIDPYPSDHRAVVASFRLPAP